MRSKILMLGVATAGVAGLVDAATATDPTAASWGFFGVWSVLLLLAVVRRRTQQVLIVRAKPLPLR